MADIELVIKIPEEDYNNIEPFLNGETIKGGFNLFKALEIIKNGKPLEQEPKIGHWIENAPEYQNIDPPYICSECGNMHLRKTNYCDQCGAKMVESHESEVAK